MSLGSAFLGIAIGNAKYPPVIEFQGKWVIGFYSVTCFCTHKLSCASGAVKRPHYVAFYLEEESKLRDTAYRAVTTGNSG